MDQYELAFKIVLIGSAGTGKTNIALRYINNEFKENSAATVGVQFMKKMVRMRGKQFKVTVWDTAGQERYRSLSKVYYKGADGIIVVYDTTNLESYLKVESWMHLANENLDLSQVQVVLVGNKVDIANERTVPAGRPAKDYGDRYDIDCREVSAKTGLNVEELFTEMLGKMYERYLERAALKADYERAEQEELKRKQAETSEENKIAPAGIKKQPEIKSKRTTLEKEGRRREKERKDKKGCC